MSKKTFSYTESLKELEGIVSKIESGECDPDELSMLVKRAAELLQICRNKLRETEKNINEILNQIDTENEE